MGKKVTIQLAEDAVRNPENLGKFAEKPNTALSTGPRLSSARPVV